MTSNISPLAGQIAAVRGFSRFYTRKLGIIEPKLLQSPWTLQEARIIYEIADRQSCNATELSEALLLDADSCPEPYRPCNAGRSWRESRRNQTAGSPSSH